MELCLEHEEDRASGLTECPVPLKLDFSASTTSAKKREKVNDLQLIYNISLHSNIGVLPELVLHTGRHGIMVILAS